MKIDLTNKQLTIQLSGTERLLGFHIGAAITIPVTHIKTATNDEPAKL